MDNLIQQKIIDANSVFTSYYINSKALYMYVFNEVPCISFLDHINGAKAFEAFKAKYADLVQSVHSYRMYERQKKHALFSDTILVLKNNCVLEFDKHYCEILHSDNSSGFVNELLGFLRTFKERQRSKPREINLVMRDAGELELKPMPVKKTSLDIDLYYEDDFKQVDEVIRRRLNSNNDKGIALLHGLPGTGKTTYLRYLIGKIRKRVLFLPPNMAASLADPEFIDLLVNNANSVLIIEDAENIVMDRRSGGNTAVSNLLNISDGLLADFLNVQLICTFNSPLTMVDQALLRKGRLIAQYEFGKLSIPKAKKLSTHFGFDNVITRPMTIAELANQHEREYAAPRVEVIGFRRAVIQN